MAGFLIAVTIDIVLDNNPLVILFYHISVEIIPMIAVLLILSKPTSETKIDIEFEPSNNDVSEESISEPASNSAKNPEEDNKDASTSSMPNSKLYYASHPRSYHWARVLDSNESLPFTVTTYQTDFNPNENTNLLWEVDDNYVENKKS